MSDRQLVFLFQSMMGIPEAEASQFLSLFRQQTYKRNTLLLREGQTAHELFFVLDGVLRQYFIQEDGAERTCNFSFEHGFLTDLESFSRQSKSATHIVTLTPATCLVISCQDLADAMKQSPAIADFFRMVIERVATEGIRRMKSMLAQTPDKQFEALMHTDPQIVQRVPQRYIAQYLGIAPESLSRIRKRLMQAQKS